MHSLFLMFSKDCDRKRRCASVFIGNGDRYIFISSNSDMFGKARVKTMDIIKEYKRVLEDIAVIESQLQTTKRELDKTVNIYRPSDIKGIDYAEERVTGSMFQPDIFCIAEKLDELKRQIRSLQNELLETHEQRRKLEKAINEFGSVEKQVAKYKVKGWTNEKIAKELGYSKSWIDKISSRINKECNQSAI